MTGEKKETRSWTVCVSMFKWFVSLMCEIHLLEASFSPALVSFFFAVSLFILCNVKLPTFSFHMFICARETRLLGEVRSRLYINLAHVDISKDGRRVAAC